MERTPAWVWLGRLISKESEITNLVIKWIDAWMKIIGRRSPERVSQETLLSVKNEMNLLSRTEQDIKVNGRIV